MISFLENTISDTHPDFDSIHTQSCMLQKSGSLCNYTTILKYKTHQIHIIPLHPFALSIPCKEFTWISLLDADKIIPNSIELKWDTSLFSDFQIKLTPDTNFKLECTPFYKYRLLRCHGHIIYLFEKQPHHNHCIDLTCTLIPSISNDTLKGHIHISYGQQDYTYDKHKTYTYITKMKELITELKQLEQSVVLDQNENETQINTYKQVFENKMKHIHDTT